MELEARTLTPIWCGGIDRSSDFIKESGLIGSLRFWFDGLLRGQGKRVCGPMAGAPGSRSCQVASGTRAEIGALCASCRVFGCTGWARQFRLEVEGLTAVPVFFKASAQVARASGNWLWNIFAPDVNGGSRTRKGRETAYTFGACALWSSSVFRLRIEPRVGAPEGTEQALKLTLDTIFRLGGWGAKTQYGFGQVTSNMDSQGCLESLLIIPGQAETPTSGAFVLNDNSFFHLRHAFPRNWKPEMETIGQMPSGYREEYIPCAFDIRYKYQMKDPLNRRFEDRGLRPDIAYDYGADVAREWFGYVEGNNSRASRIHVSHLFKERDHYSVSVWGDRYPGISQENTLGSVTDTLNEWCKSLGGRP